VSDFEQMGAAGLDGELVKHRAAPRDEFLAGLVRQIEGPARRSRRAGVGALVVAAGLALVALSASGAAGLDYSSTAVRKIASVVHLDQSRQIQRPTSPSRAQYGPVPVPPYPPSKGGSNPPQPPTTTPPNNNGGGSFTPPEKPGSGTSNPGSGTSNPGSGETPGGSGVEGASGSGNPSSSGSGGLPFTGLALWVPVAAGLGLVALGFGIRRGTRRDSS
jgi:hypothetical protein